jgi:hypothetical protein
MKLTRAPLPDLPPPVVLRSALTALRLVQRGTQALTPGELALWDAMVGVARTELVGLAARLSLAEHVGEGALSAEAIAERAGCHADTLFRAMRAMAAMGLFALRSDGRFEQTAMSRALMKDAPRSLRDGALYFSSASNMEAWRSLEHSVRTGESAFEHAHGMSVWDWFAQHPDELETFASAMGRATAIEAPQLATLYPFAEITTLCDVGGGSGTLLSELLVRHPHLRGVLCDAPGVLERARDLLSSRAVLDRVTLVPGSFFDRVPAGCDGYTLKNVLHDWDDERSLKILRIVREAARPGARVILFESVIEPLDSRPEATMSDLQMVVACSGRERSVDELRSLLGASGFRPGRVARGAHNSMIEGVAA